MPPDPRSIRAALARLGDGAVRATQLMALRRDLFDPTAAAALALQPTSRLVPSAEAISILTREGGHNRAALLGSWLPVAEPGPLAWTAHGVEAQREVRVRVTLPAVAPDAATLAAAIRLALPLIATPDRDAARRLLHDDLTRWLAAELDTPAQHIRLGRWRRQALARTGTIVARPLDDWVAPHLIGIARLPALPLPQVVALAASGGEAALDAHDIDAVAIAQRLIEAALEQAMVFGSIPIEPRLDHLGVMPGDRIARIDVGGVEALSPALGKAIPGLARAAIAGDAGLVAARLAALLTSGDDADPADLTARLERVIQPLEGNDHPRTDPERLLDDGLAAVRASGHGVPADLLALGRWLAAMASAAVTIDPAVDIGDIARRFMLRRELEQAVELPDSLETARRVLAVVAPLETLPGRLDRLIADAASGSYRLPIEQHRSAVDRQLRLAQARLMAVAIGWTGIALLLLVAAGLPAGLIRTGLTGLLWAGAAGAAGLFLLLWRRTL